LRIDAKNEEIWKSFIGFYRFWTFLKCPKHEKPAQPFPKMQKSDLEHNAAICILQIFVLLP
jgi:hypothetical protein